ncbi:MAG: rRNA maturation RNase YbeY [Candidatus Paceibacterota bacterium]|jgi:probable rRNA maturation factor
MQGEFSLLNTTKGKLPSLPFVQIKNDILGEKYNLSIAFVGEAKSRELNKRYRNKDKSTNILSFSLSKNAGELILCQSVIKKEYKNFDRELPEFIGFLVIHGMLHLKGFEHSSKMEREEQKYDKKYFYRSGHRLGNNQSHRRRISKRRKKS